MFSTNVLSSDSTSYFPTLTYLNPDFFFSIHIFFISIYGFLFNVFVNKSSNGTVAVKIKIIGLVFNLNHKIKNCNHNQSQDIN